MAKGVVFYLLSMWLVYAPVSYSWIPEDGNEHNRQEEQIKRRQACKNRVEELLATNQSLAHLNQDSPLLDGDVYYFPDLVQRMLQRKPDLEVVDHDGATPLCVAISHNNTSGIKLLLKEGANPNHIAKLADDENLPLHHAIKFGYLEIVQDLLAYGANPNKQRRSHFCLDYRPLDEVVESSALWNRGRQPMARLLLAYGGDPELRNTNGLNALQSLKQKYELDLKYYRDSAWRHKAIGHMFIYYSTVKRILTKIPIDQNNRLPNDIARYITQFVFAGKEAAVCLKCMCTSVDVTTGCRHSFCNSCINSWLITKNNCPICKVVLIKAKVMYSWPGVCDF